MEKMLSVCPVSHSAMTPPMMASGCASMMMSGCRKELNWLASTMYNSIKAKAKTKLMFLMVLASSSACPVRRMA